jgi:hypothetical protein
MSNSNFKQHLNNQKQQHQPSAPKSLSFNSNLELLKNEMVKQHFLNHLNIISKKYIF